VIKKHDVGVVLQAHNSQNIAESINFLINDEKELKRLKRNCIQATQTECWEKEKETLLNYFPPPLASE
jgi:hypothetical protein